MPNNIISLTRFLSAEGSIEILTKLETIFTENAQISAGLTTKTLQCHHVSTIIIKISHNLVVQFPLSPTFKK